MNWHAIFAPQGLNYWLISSALGWNLMVDYGLVILAFQILKLEDRGVALFQIAVLIGSFLAAALAGWAAGRIAGDGRGPAYGVYGSLGGAFLLLYMLVPSGGVLGLIVALSVVFGGFNGGLLSSRR